ncbi:MAG: toxin-antitoxin system protein [Clostridia bacterium]|nr:toxin-antitoxin system protein [Clostridia bacterium]
MTKPLKRSISLTLDDDLITILQEWAELDDRSFSGYINLILRRYINKEMNAAQNKNCAP